MHPRRVGVVTGSANCRQTKSLLSLKFSQQRLSDRSQKERTFENSHIPRATGSDCDRFPCFVPFDLLGAHAAAVNSLPRELSLAPHPVPPWSPSTADLLPRTTPPANEPTSQRDVSAKAFDACPGPGPGYGPDRLSPTAAHFTISRQRPLLLSKNDSSSLILYSQSHYHLIALTISPAPIQPLPNDCCVRANGVLRTLYNRLILPAQTPPDCRDFSRPQSAPTPGQQPSSPLYYYVSASGDQPITSYTILSLCRP